ncbi:hypothetical protein [Derxia gummosa]|uniref:FlgN protein n=1 Tax=Derxia gummosa DSM 723 TaxID=1121388 RepID=A0A8B6X6D6_9BURK|nr:hypothetical protein [Derxia gummosa]
MTTPIARLLAQSARLVPQLHDVCARAATAKPDELEALALEHAGLTQSLAECIAEVRHAIAPMTLAEALARHALDHPDQARDSRGRDWVDALEDLRRANAIAGRVILQRLHLTQAMLRVVNEARGANDGGGFVDPSGGPFRRAGNGTGYSRAVA